MHLFIERGMRGGISYISKQYRSNRGDKTIMYWDANNLYGWSMIKSLPYCNFKGLNDKEMNDFDLDSIS